MQRKFVQKRWLQKSEALSFHGDVGMLSAPWFLSRHGVMLSLELSFCDAFCYNTLEFWRHSMVTKPYKIGFVCQHRAAAGMSASGLCCFSPGQLDIEMSFRQSVRLKWVTPKDISGRLGWGVAKQRLEDRNGRSMWVNHTHIWWEGTSYSS